ncbi:PREDICTED: calpain-1 catalytic subunit-like [Cyprinodon variegatus]|uniref:Calpain-1 catalytic subunit-like n=1 Tax=Cyprinodon variegatus TaxID=28743 RepID=A0A3Q2DFN2_CYPVA|nr:PREDICTED: calpain-1 catalytic subunit-like [Cyprinodon variegatus]
MLAPGVCMNIINERRTKDGYGTFSNPEKFLNQDYQVLKEYCLIQRKRYTDDMFPADRWSISRETQPPSYLDHVKWLRPREIVSNPSFVVDGISRFDFGQGWADNCWFLSAVGALTFQDSILKQVVPLEQSFDEDYCGLFHFRFWRFGKWVDVVIDDKLPTIQGKLIFVHSNTPTEFWPALLEKAYAKVCGSYSDMNAGSPSEALVDFTGGVHICLDLAKRPPNLWELMSQASLAKSLIGCGTLPGTSTNSPLENGLVQGHAYTVTGVKQVLSRGKAVRLVRLWNPWGHGEWNGDWSDQSSLWQTVSHHDRETMLSVCEDGEFWMSLKDFCESYADIDICCLCPSFLDGSSPIHWKTSRHEGRWVAGVTAGGCMNYPESFWTNPQYRVKIGECREQGENIMLVSLMQKQDKRHRRQDQNINIGFNVFEVPQEHQGKRGKFPACFFSRAKCVNQTETYKDAREVMKLMTLEPGEYLIVPATFDPNMTVSFILTILSKSEINVYENSDACNLNQMEPEKTTSQDNVADEDNKRTLFRQISGQYVEVDAEQLKHLLNERILKGDLKSGGFSTDACRSMVALMDTSVTGKLDDKEFIGLWRKIVAYKDIFYHSDVSRTGTLSLSELRKAIMAIGKRSSDNMLNLMALRYGDSSGYISLENFIGLALRFERMSQMFSNLSNGTAVTLQEPEWMYLVMYS